MKSLVHTVIIFTISFLVNGCGGGGSGGEAQSISTPTATFSPSLRPIHTNEVIVVSFSESMDISQGYTITGAMAAESDGGIWSKTNTDNDTLTISAMGGVWSESHNRDLIINAQGLSGNSLATLTLTYDIFNGTFYFVNNTAVDDTGNGLTVATAKKTIRSAINTAEKGGGIVFVSAGTYTVDSTPGVDSQIILVPSISLYGGYNASFSDQNPSLYTSIIKDIGTGGAPTNRAVQATSSGLTSSNVMDGFTILGSTDAAATNTAAIYVTFAASPLLQNLVINGGSGSSNSYGITTRLSTSSPTIKNNTINGGTSLGSSYGIHVSVSAPDIQSNTITGGGETGTTAAYGIYVSSAPVLLIKANTIHSGISNELSSAIYSDSASPNIDSNTLIAETALTTYGVAIRGTSAPYVANNTIYGGDASNVSAGIYSTSSGAVVITKNTIDGGSGAAGSRGIYNVLSSPSIIANTINGGVSTISSQGIYNFSSSSPSVVNNVIFGGTAPDSRGMTNWSNSAPIVRNNTINGGMGANNSISIFNATTGNPHLQNNILITRNGAGSYCIFSTDTGIPATIHNNNMFGCNIIYTDATDFSCTGNADGDNNDSTCTLAEMEASTNIPNGASGNVEVDALFIDIDGADNDITTMADNDWHFSVSSPASVTAGGLNGIDETGWTFTVDKDAVTRPASGTPWSIGAYEPTN